MPMCKGEVDVGLISEKRTRPSGSQVRPDAFGRRRVGWPPSTGTVHVSQDPLSIIEKATREPSGVKTGANLLLGSFVKGTASPFGSCLT